MMISPLRLRPASILALTAMIVSVFAALPVRAADDDQKHLSEIDGLRVVHAWTRATEESTALVFMEIENTSDASARLLGGEAHDGIAVELVGFQLKDGVEAYVPVPGVPIEPGRELELAPNGLALRLSGLTEPLDEGGEFEVTVEFDIGHVEVHVAVEAANATQHGHAGHAH